MCATRPGLALSKLLNDPVCYRNGLGLPLEFLQASTCQNTLISSVIISLGQNKLKAPIFFTYLQDDQVDISPLAHATLPTSTTC